MDTPVIEAINMFVDRHVTALPVIDQESKLIKILLNIIFNNECMLIR
jgi:CBS domain-containing protein